MLIVDDFGVEHVGKCQADHLLEALLNDYKVTVNEKSDLFTCIKLQWNYNKQSVRLSMDEYIAKLRAKFNHPDPKKPQHYPHRHTPINYGVKVQYATDVPDSPLLSDAGLLHIQHIISATRYYARAADYKLLVVLSNLS